MLWWCVASLGIFSLAQCVKDFVPYSEQDKTVQVEIQKGPIQGLAEKTDEGFNFFSFMGIPFAQPPLGNLRFRAPKPPLKWEGVLDVRKPANCCAGINLPGMSIFNFQYEGEEDCLYLNVYTPSLPKPNSADLLKPVMVFFYGGGFLGGCADRQYYGPDYLVVHDVVLVTVNYRLSIFGGLSTQDDECPGNWALKDQILALKWVQKNIERFSGDPSKVTIFGQSAGAAYSSYLMMSPQAKELFRAVIMESGSALCPWSNLKAPRQLAFDVGISAGIKTNSSKELLAYLRGRSSLELKEAQIAPVVVSIIQGLNDGLPFGPTIENRKDGFLLENSFDAMQRGHYHKVPVLMGLNSLEYLYFDGVMKLLLSLKSLLDITPSLLSRYIDDPGYRYRMGKRIREFFVESDNFESATPKELYEMMSNDFYVRPLSKTATLLAQYNSVYFYQFTFSGLLGLKALQMLAYVTKKLVPGAGHAEEVVYIFKTFLTPPLNKIPLEDQIVVKKITKLWTNFAKFGNPTPRTDPELDNVIWPTVLINQPPFVKNYLEISENLTVHYNNFREKEVSFWEQIYQKFRKKPYLFGY